MGLALPHRHLASVAQGMDFSSSFIIHYDAALFSLPEFAQRLLLSQYLTYPAIDPLSDQNRDLTEDKVESILKGRIFRETDPFCCRFPRFDRFKDPIGVVEAFRIVRKRNRAVLVLAGGGAIDDPEQVKVLAEVQEAIPISSSLSFRRRPIWKRMRSTGGHPHPPKIPKGGVWPNGFGSHVEG